MSAIFGLINWDGRPALETDLNMMSAALAAHGPDGNGIWAENHVGMGCRLMCFTPEDRLEQQPLSGARGSYMLVVDGRVDNRPELIHDLGITSAEAREMADSAFILRAYEKWGPDCCSRLVGNFAFALHDRREAHIVVARSAMSKRMLYYHAGSRQFAFASAPKGLFALPWIPREIDQQSLADFLVWAPRDPGRSYFAGVSELPAGHAMVIRRGGLTSHEHSQPYLRPKIRFRRDTDYIEAFHALYERVIGDYLRSLSPVGVAMSGGLDSSSVAVTAARLLAKRGTRLPTFTQVPRVGFDQPLEANKYADETLLVQAIARQCGDLDPNFVRTDGGLLLDGIGPYFDAVEGPTRAPWNRIWWEAMLRQARAGNIRVLLTGGSGNLTISRKGDALFPQLLRRGRWLRAFQEARACAKQGAGNSALGVLAPPAAALLPLPLWLAVRALARPRDPVRADAPWQSYSPIRPEFAGVHRLKERAQQNGYDFYARPRYRTPREQYEIVRRWGAETPVTAGYEALFGVQDRDPAGDSRIVEFCMSLPESQHLHYGVPRSLIRRAMAGRVPPEVLANRRTGLQLADWFERATAGRSQMLDELARIERSDLAQTALDLPRVRKLLENMPKFVSEPAPLLYRSFLGAAFITGTFLRWFESPGAVVRGRLMEHLPDMSSGLWHYTHSGLGVASELPVPGWPPCSQGSVRPVDVEIRLKRPAVDSADTLQASSVITREYTLQAPGVGLLRVRRGCEIQVELLPSAVSASVLPWLTGSAWGALCYQRGLFVVHASAVQIGGEAVLFCGAAGQGKSTLAAQLADRGHAVIGDDLCRLDLPPEGPALIYPAAPRMKLWSDAIGELGWGHRELAPDHLREGKFHISLTGHAMSEPLPVRAAYSLAWGEFGVRPLYGMAAFRNFLAAATWQRQLLESMGQTELHINRCVEFLRRVPLAELTRARDFEMSSGTPDFLVGREQHAGL